MTKNFIENENAVNTGIENGSTEISIPESIGIMENANQNMAILDDLYSICKFLP